MIHAWIHTPTSLPIVHTPYQLTKSFSYHTLFLERYKIQDTLYWASKLEIYSFIHLPLVKTVFCLSMKIFLLLKAFQNHLGRKNCILPEVNLNFQFETNWLVSRFCYLRLNTKIQMTSSSLWACANCVR